MSDEFSDQLNRFLVSVIALLLAFAALVLVLLAWGAPDRSIDQLSDLALWLEEHHHREQQLIFTLGALVVVLLMAMVVIYEITPSPTQRMRVRNVGSGAGTITTTEIAERVQQEILGVPHVAQCRAVVAARRGAVEVVLDLQVEPASDLSRTADEACRRTEELVERNMNIKLAAPPRARLHYRELRLAEGAAGRPVTGWERPGEDEGAHGRHHTDASEEAQA